MRPLGSAKTKGRCRAGAVSRTFTVARLLLRRALFRAALSFSLPFRALPPTETMYHGVFSERDEW